MTRAPDFRERAGFQSNAQTGGARSTGNLRARGGVRLDGGPEGLSLLRGAAPPRPHSKRTAVPETMRVAALALARTAAPTSARHAPTTA